MSLMLMWLAAGMLGNSVFLLALLQKGCISEMNYVVCMSNGMGHFHSSPGSHRLGVLQAEELPRASI